MNVVIFITCANSNEAKKIAQHLVGQKLVACVNILQSIESIFWWKQTVDSANEILLIAKSKKSLMPKIIKGIKSLHSYDVPEIIALPIISGNKDYLDWIDESLR